MARLVPLLAILLVALTTSLPHAHAQTTDARDYEGVGGAPNNTIILANYLRHSTTTDRRNLTTNSSSFRADWLVRAGNFGFTPLSFLLSVADADARVGAAPGSSVNPASIRTTGFGDLIYLPAMFYDIVEDKAERTHTYLTAQVYTTIPTGTYDSTKQVNIGENRWALKPQLGVGQRFAKRYTFELVGNMQVFMDNTDFMVPGKAASMGMPAVPPSKQTLQQDPTFGGEVHFSVDVDPTTWLGLSYYATNIGKKSIAANGTELEAPASVQTLRFTWGWHIEKQTLLLVQFQQDVAATGEASRAHFYGLRLSRFFF
jgi:hypothetical protein